MERRILLSVVFLLLVSPVFAVGNLNITSTGLAPAFINTKTLTSMLNLTMNSTNGNTSISSINVTIGGNATIGNVSLVALINSTGSVIASSSANSTPNKFTVTISPGFTATSGANTSLIIAINLSAFANPSSNVSVQISAPGDFGVNSGSNTTFDNFVNSTQSEIRDLHASVSIYPNFVDTNAINQTIIYSILPTGADAIKNITILVPSGYGLVNVSTIMTLGSTNPSLYSYATDPGHINVTLATPTTQLVNVTFNTNTSSSRVNSVAFASTITGGNLNGVSTDGYVNVTTQMLINVTNIALAKGAALVNGTDYWEFNFTLAFTANVTGTIQFKMSNWTDASGNILSLNSGSTNYATLRNSTNCSDVNSNFNVSASYSSGITQTVTDGGTLALMLRMIVPFRTPISNTWAATYGFLFRAA